MYNSDLPSISTMADNSKLIKWLNSKFDEIGEQLTLNGNTMIRIEKEMSGRISTNKEEITAVKKVAEATAATVDTATSDIEELKKKNKALEDGMQKMAEKMEAQGSALDTVSLSHLDSKRRRYRK